MTKGNNWKARRTMLLAGSAIVSFYCQNTFASCSNNFPLSDGIVICNATGGTDLIGVVAPGSNRVTVNVSGAMNIGGINVATIGLNSIAINLGNLANVSNSGFIGAAVTAGGFTAVGISSASLTLTNSGIIQSSNAGISNGFGVLITTGGDVINQSSGLIQSNHSGTAGNSYGMFSDHTTINNAGVISSVVTNAGGYVNSRGIDGDSAVITNSGMIQSIQDGLGFSVGIYSDSGTLNNASGGTVRGVITNNISGNQAAGFVNLNGASFSITNQGGIGGYQDGRGENFAIRGNGGTIVNVVGGRILAEHTGSGGSNTGIFGNNVTFQNAGALIADKSNVTSIGQGNQALNGSNAHIVNNGLISAIERAHGFNFGLNVNNGLTLANGVGGMISSNITNGTNYQSSIAVSSTAGAATISNSGSINSHSAGTGRALGISIQNGTISNIGGVIAASSATQRGVGINIQTVALGDLTAIINSGTIRGDLASIQGEGPGHVDIINSGTLTGDILLSSNDDNLTFQHGTHFEVTSTGGSVLADGGSGNNILTLQNGIAEQDASSANFVNWNIDSLASGSWTLSGSIGDGGAPRAVIQNGTGTLTLSGNNSFTGGLTINNGRVIAAHNHALGISDVTVTAGVLQIGDNIDQTVTLGGAYNQGPAGSLQILLGQNGSGALQASHLSITGTAQLDGRVIYQVGQGVYLPGHTATFLSAGGGISGAFSSSETLGVQSAFIDFQTTYPSAGQVDVTIVPRSNAQGNIYASIARTFNQRNVGQSIGEIARQIGGGTGRDIDQILGNINSLNAQEAREAYDQISGVLHGNVITATDQIVKTFISAIGARASLTGHSSNFAGNSFASGGTVTASAPLSINDCRQEESSGGTSCSARVQTGSNRAWLRSYGSFGELESDNNATGANYDNAGVALGIETDAGGSAILGVALGYTNTDLDENKSQDKAEINSYEAALYGKINNLPLGAYIAGDIGYAFHDIDTERQIDFSLIDRQAKSDQDNHSVFSGLEIGRSFTIWDDKNNDLSSSAEPRVSQWTSLSIVPHIGFDYVHQFRESFQERGANALNLDINGEDNDSLRIKAGFETRALLNLGGWNIVPYLGLTYAYEALDSTKEFDAKLNDATANRFSVRTPHLGRHFLLSDVGLAVHLNDIYETGVDSQFFVNYGNEYSGESSVHEITGGIRLTW